MLSNGPGGGYFLYLAAAENAIRDLSGRDDDSYDVGKCGAVSTVGGGNAMSFSRMNGATAARAT